MAEIRTKEGLVVGLIEPTTDTSQDKPVEQKQQETTTQRSTRGRKQHDTD